MLIESLNCINNYTDASLDFLIQSYGYDQSFFDSIIKLMDSPNIRVKRPILSIINNFLYESDDYATSFLDRDIIFNLLCKRKMYIHPALLLSIHTSIHPSILQSTQPYFYPTLLLSTQPYFYPTNIHLNSHLSNKKRNS